LGKIVGAEIGRGHQWDETPEARRISTKGGGGKKEENLTEKSGADDIWGTFTGNPKKTNLPL